MLIHNSLAEKRIIDCLINDYGMIVKTLTQLQLGADINSSVYKVETEEQSLYFAKLKHGHHHDISIDILELLHKFGIKQIIYPLKNNHGQLSKRIDDYTLVVYPFVEGQNGFTHTLNNEQWQMLGQALRQVHNIDAPNPIQQQLRRETWSPKWRDIVRSIDKQLDTVTVVDEPASKLLAFMQDHSAAIHQLVDCAEKLAEMISHASPRFVLCHSDIHAGNVLIANNNAIYIVDWDEPIMAPKERDLMFIGGGVGNVWNKPEEIELFYQGYGKTEINMDTLAYYRHERIVEDIAIYAQQLLLSTAGGDARQEMYKHFTDMFAPRGVVDIAFETE